MQVLRAVSVAEACEALAEPGLSLRTYEQRLHQRAQVEARSAHEYWGVITPFNLSDHLSGKACPIAGGEILGGLDDVDQVMRDVLTFGLRDFCCRNVNSSVDLDGIEVDDLAAARKS